MRIRENLNFSRRRSLSYRIQSPNQRTGLYMITVYVILEKIIGIRYDTIETISILVLTETQYIRIAKEIKILLSNTQLYCWLLNDGTFFQDTLKLSHGV